MAQGFTPTTGAAFLQNFYKPGFIANSIAAKSSPAVRNLPKEPDGGGSQFVFLSVVDEANIMQSSTYTDAIANVPTNTFGGQFAIPWQETDTVWTVSGLAIAQTRNDNAAWTSALKFSMDSALRWSAHRRSIDWYTQGWGEVAQIFSISGSTFKCQDKGTIFRFIKGQPLVFALSLNADALRSGTADMVTGVDYSNNVVTCGTALSTPGAVAGDFVFLYGDRQNSSTPARLRPIGYPAWTPFQPVTDTTLSTLGGVVRSTNSRYYGNYVDGTQLAIKDALTVGLQTLISIGNVESKITTFMSPDNFTALSNDLGSDRRYIEDKGYGASGFDVLKFFANGGSTIVVTDKYIGNAYIAMYDEKAFVHASIGPAPHVNADDGNTILRQSNDNGIEGRLVAYENFASINPPGTVIIQLPTPTP